MVILGLATTILFISIFGNGGNFLGTFTLGIGTDVGGLGTLGKDGAPGNVGTLGKDGAPDNVGTLGKDGVDIVIIIYTNASSINPSNACVNSASLIVSIFAAIIACKSPDILVTMAPTAGSAPIIPVILLLLPVHPPGIP